MQFHGRAPPPAELRQAFAEYLGGPGRIGPSLGVGGGVLQDLRPRRAALVRQRLGGPETGPPERVHHDGDHDLLYVGRMSGLGPVTLERAPEANADFLLDVVRVQARAGAAMAADGLLEPGAVVPQQPLDPGVLGVPVGRDARLGRPAQGFSWRCTAAAG